MKFESFVRQAEKSKVLLLRINSSNLKFDCIFHIFKYGQDFFNSYSRSIWVTLPLPKYKGVHFISDPGDKASFDSSDPPERKSGECHPTSERSIAF